MDAYECGVVLKSGEAVSLAQSCVPVSVCVCVCVRACVCERERVCVCLCVWVCGYMCERERERERVCVNGVRDRYALMWAPALTGISRYCTSNVCE